jgi:hypothetical protein
VHRSSVPPCAGSAPQAITAGIIRKFPAREGKFLLEELGAPDARTLLWRPSSGNFLTAINKEAGAA